MYFDFYVVKQQTYWYWESDDEDPTKCTKTTRKFPKECLRLNVITHSCECHQTPPDTVIEGPVIKIICCVKKLVSNVKASFKTFRI